MSKQYQIFINMFQEYVSMVLHPILINFLFGVAGGGCFSCYIHRGNKSNKERKIVKEKLNFINTEKIIHVLTLFHVTPVANLFYV